MKKSVVITVLMLLALVCAAAAQSVDFADTWYLNYMSMDGENLISAADMGLDAKFILEDDGTAVSDGDGEIGYGTWEESEGGVMINFEDNPMELVYEDGFLVAEIDGGFMVFSTEEPGPGYVPADPAEDVEPEDFEGVWVPFKIGMEGVGYLDWAAMSSEMESLGLEDCTIVIEDGMVSLFGEEPTDEYKFQEDGTMAYVNDDPNLSMLNSVMTIDEDGYLSVTYLGMITFVMEKVDEEGLY